MCVISLYVTIACSHNVSHGVAQTVSQSTSLFWSYVLPNFLWVLDFCLNLSPAIRLIDGALRMWGRHILGWPSGSPNAAVFLELGWPLNVSCPSSDAPLPCQMVSERCPLPAFIFQTALSVPGSWASRSVSAILWVFSVLIFAASALVPPPMVFKPCSRLTSLFL